LELYEQNFDVWTQNKIEGYVDVMIHQNQLSQMYQKYPNHKITIPNVQMEFENNTARRNPNPQFFDTYPTTAEVYDWLDQQIAANPLITRRISLGNTYLGKEIRGIQIGSNPNSPIVYFHCTIHAREWITTTTCAWMIDQLLNLDPDRKDLVERANWIIVPILNVDGYDYCWSDNRGWRKNRQPNTGSTCIGTDLNRNYGDHWSFPGASGNPCTDTFYGAAPFSGPEVNAEQRFLRDLGDDLVSFIDIHASGAMFMSPWGWTPDEYPLDYNIMLYYMEVAVKAISSVNGRNYAYGPAARVIYTASGISSDWTYGGLGLIPSYSIEVGSSGFIPPVEQIPLIGREIWAGNKAYVQALVT
jgi:hypothetical protein